VTASIKRTHVVQGLINGTTEQLKDRRKHQLRDSAQVLARHRVRKRLSGRVTGTAVGSGWRIGSVG
jgi:hypothetical protein